LSSAETIRPEVTVSAVRSPGGAIPTIYEATPWDAGTCSAPSGVLLSHNPMNYTFADPFFHEPVRIIMSDPEIVMSLLCREIIEDGAKIKVDRGIYGG
jgi:hypothetical protein